MDKFGRNKMDKNERKYFKWYKKGGEDTSNANNYITILYCNINILQLYYNIKQLYYNINTTTSATPSAIFVITRSTDVYIYRVGVIVVLAIDACLFF